MTPAPRPATWTCLGTAALSGVLLWACYFPLAWGTWLAWVALVPLLTLVRSEARPWVIYRSVWLGGLIFFAAALSWMTVADPRMIILWGLLATYCSLYFPLAIALVRWLDRRWRLPLVLSVPVVWLALEYVRSWFLTGFSWYFLGYMLQAALPFIQIADLGGVFAVSLLVAAVNALLCDMLYQVPAVRARFGLMEPGLLERCANLFDFPIRKNLIAEAVIVAALVAAAFAYGQHRLGQNRFEPGPTVALVQGNLDQRLRNDAALPGEEGLSPRQAMIRHYARLCERAMTFPRPDLIVWPETSYPSEWIEVSPQLALDKVPTAWRDAEVEQRDHLLKTARACPANHLLGMNTNFLDAQAHHRRYNSALLLGAGGSVEARFDKMHRIPFGEYVPLRDWLPFMNRLAPYDFDYSIQPGESFTRFQLGAYRFGALICYEDSDPYLARHYVVAEPEGPPVDFLVNLSNDGWFDGTSEHDEHLAVSRFRAIECRRALVRSVNMGISAVIDGNGRVLEPRQFSADEPALWSIVDDMGRWKELPAAAWSKFKKSALVVKAVVPLDRRGSFYARVGDVLPIGCCLGLGIALAPGLVSSLRRVPRPRGPTARG
jgi:apolipoprotein N-acyltransferase